MQQFFLGRNVRHRLSIMRIPDIPFCVDDTVQWHAAQLEQIHFLPVHSRNGMIGVRQADKGNPLIFPILFEGRRLIGSNSQDFYPAALELSITVSQARQLRAAVWSHKAAQESQHDRLASKRG